MENPLFVGREQKGQGGFFRRLYFFARGSRGFLKKKNRGNRKDADCRLGAKRVLFWLVLGLFFLRDCEGAGGGAGFNFRKGLGGQQWASRALSKCACF